MRSALSPTSVSGALLRLSRDMECLIGEHRALHDHPEDAKGRMFSDGVYTISGNRVLAYARSDGDSRYPYGRDGFNLWVHASGRMHCNEGLFSPFLRRLEGQEPAIAFFAGLPDSGEQWSPFSLLPTPMLGLSENPQVDRLCFFDPCAANFITLLPHLRFLLRVFVTDERGICFSICAQNLGSSAQSILLSSFLNPFLRNQLYMSDEDVWFKEVRVIEAGEASGSLPSFLVRVNEDWDRERSTTHWGVLRRRITLGEGSRLLAHEETASRTQFVGGQRSSLHTPLPLRRGTFGDPRSLCTFTTTGAAGDLLRLDLSAGGAMRLDLQFDHTDDDGKATALQRANLCPVDLDRALARQCIEEEERHRGLSVLVGSTSASPLRSRVFNAFFEQLKRQVEFCSLIRGYVQLHQNSLIGIRDVFQALEGLLLWQPEVSRAKMLEAIEHMEPSGRCFRQYSLPAQPGQVGRMDLRPFIDQGAWVISCVMSYLRATGDWEFLDEICGYHDIVDEERGRVRVSALRDSVLEHLLHIMDHLLEHRDHGHTGCLRALFGDWNDALDGLGVSPDDDQSFGTGVSVMATLQLHQSAREMAELLHALDDGKWTEQRERFLRAADDLAADLHRHAVVNGPNGDRRILHGWGDRRSYLIGGFDDPDGQARDSLTANAFWVLSGMVESDPGLIPVILAAFDRLDGKYGLRTFAPHFPDGAPGVGRIGKLPPGTGENGATYVHATAFGIMALFQLGRPREAWEQLIKILPFTDVHAISSHSPFVIPNSYGHNSDKQIDGQSMNDWQTGSSNVVLKTLVRCVFGYEPTLGGVWIQPAAWSPFGEFDFGINARGCDLRILYRRIGSGQRRFTVNGVECTGTRDELRGIDKLWLPWEQISGRTIEISVLD